MFNLAASVFGAVGAFFGGMFGGHLGLNSSTNMPFMHAPQGYYEASTSTEFRRMMPPLGGGVFGTVTAINSSILTVVGRQATSTASTTYGVDASNARIIVFSTTTMATTTGSISDIKVGDRVAVQGTIGSSNTIAATVILDGPFMMRGRSGWNGEASTTWGMWRNGSSTEPIYRMHRPNQNLQPPVQGTVNANDSVQVNTDNIPGRMGVGAGMRGGIQFGDGNGQ